jgi:flagellar basal body-associated protein FliL
MNTETTPNNKKIIWIAVGVLLILALCGLLVWLGSGMVEMLKAHLGI